MTAVVGRIFTARMRELDVTQADLAKLLGISTAQMSKILRGKARLDIDQYASVCTILGASAYEIWQQAESELSSTVSRQGGLRRDELQRRMQFLIDKVADGDPARAFGIVRVGLMKGGQTMSSLGWQTLLRLGVAPNLDVLSLIAESFGVDPRYLHDEDMAVVQRAESAVNLAALADETGVEQLSARGNLTPDDIARISEYLAKKFSGGKPDAGPHETA